MVAPSLLQPVPRWQVHTASVIALGWTAAVGASASTRVLEMLPEGSSLRRALQRWHDVCKESPALDCARTLSVVLAWVWRHSVVIKNVSIVDIVWGLTFLVQAVSYGSHEKAEKNGYNGRRSLIIAMTSTYAMRLSTFLYWRNHVSTIGVGVVGGSAEDYRYQKFRRFWDSKGYSYWWFSLVQVFTLQGALSFTVGQPLRAAQTEEQPQEYTWLDVAGVAVFILGFFFEHTADLELVAFRANAANKGKVLRTGLWAHTRHPNYFGNAAMWWGIWLVACNAKGGWKTAVGPLVMNYLLLRVSGADLLESTLKRTKPGFLEYASSVPKFVPWGYLRNMLMLA